MHELLSPRTLWCLLCGSTEPRHMDDLVFALRCLLRAGFAPSQVLLFTDSSLVLMRARLKPYVPDVSRYSINPTASLADVLRRQSGYSLLITATTGHGSPSGISATPDIPQRGLLDALRSYPEEAHAVVLLGQCYAGSFNLYEGPAKPCLIGATNLAPSASLRSKPDERFESWPADFPVSAWDANIFWLNFFGWLVCPVDTDGDGRMSLLDAYKFAGIQAHEHLRRAKTLLALKLTEMSVEHEKMKKLLQRQLSKSDRVIVMKELMRLEEQVSTLFLHQEAWIENHGLADGICLTPAPP